MLSFRRDKKTVDNIDVFGEDNVVVDDAVVVGVGSKDRFYYYYRDQEARVIPQVLVTTRCDVVDWICKYLMTSSVTLIETARNNLTI